MATGPYNAKVVFEATKDADAVGDPHTMCRITAEWWGMDKPNLLTIEKSQIIGLQSLNDMGFAKVSLVAPAAG